MEQERLNGIFSIECINLPMMPDRKTVMYVEKEYNWRLNQFVATHVRKFKSAFAKMGYDFCYLPNAPQMREMVTCLSQLVNSSFNFAPSLCKFSHMDGNRAVFYCMELNIGQDQSLVLQFYDFVHQVKKAEMDRECQEALALHLKKMEESRWEQVVVKDYEVVEAVEVCEAEAYDLRSVDEELEELAMRIEKLRQRGVSEERLQGLIQQNPVSRLRITNDNRILLLDYDNAEVEMEPILKAVFFLFLRHSEGIRFKEMDDYKDELLNIYDSVSKRGTRKSHADSVAKVCSPERNLISEKCSRIREAFMKFMPNEKVVQQYCITGQNGEKKQISLDRALVSWE